MPFLYSRNTACLMKKGTEISALFFVVFVSYLCASWSMSNRSSLGGRAPVLLKGE